MKRIGLVLIIGIAIMAPAAFAMGDKDQVIAAAAEAGVKLEAVKLTGTLKQEIGKPLILTADGKEYAVMVPAQLLSGITLSQGEKVTVEGYVHDAIPGSPMGNLRVLRVVKATVQGKEYVIAGGMGRGMGRGMMDGQMGGRMNGQMGPAQGGMMGGRGGRGRW